jgi:hypothetical protein
VRSTHNSEHVDLEDALRQKVRHLTESLLRLQRKASAIAEAPTSWPANSFGFLAPGEAQRHAIFDLYQELFDLTYSTLSAYSAVLNSFPVFRGQISTGSNERFLKWFLNGELDFLDRDRSIRTLLAARDFRTVYSHAGQYRSFDWITADDERGPFVVLVGQHGGRVPDGAETLADGTWRLDGPTAIEVVRAILTIVSIYMLGITRQFPRNDERCTWERDGFGSAPAIQFDADVAEVLRDYYSSGDA